MGLSQCWRRDVCYFSFRCVWCASHHLHAPSPPTGTALAFPTHASSAASRARARTGWARQWACNWCGMCSTAHALLVVAVVVGRQGGGADVSCSAAVTVVPGTRARAVGRDARPTRRPCARGGRSAGHHWLCDTAGHTAAVAAPAVAAAAADARAPGAETVRL